MTTDTHSRRLAVGYARLSVTVDDSTSIARQKADIEKLAEAEDLELVDILVDDGVSGRKPREKAATTPATSASRAAANLAGARWGRK